MEAVEKNKNYVEGWDELMAALSSIKTESGMSSVCNFLFTFEEKEQLGKRMLLARALVDPKVSQREISKSIGVSISTVTRCSNALKSTSVSVKEKFKSSNLDAS